MRTTSLHGSLIGGYRFYFLCNFIMGNLILGIYDIPVAVAPTRTSEIYTWTRVYTEGAR